MINSIEVLIPYTSNIDIRKGDRFHFEGNNVLITGPNACGKSSLLHMIFESVRINRERAKGGDIPCYSNFEESYWKEGKKISLQENNSLNILPGKIDGDFVRTCAINNSDFFKPFPKININVLKNFYLNVANNFQEMREEDLNRGWISNYIKSIEDISKKINVPKNDLIKVFYLVDSKTLSSYELDFNNYLFAKFMEKDKSSILASYSVPGNGKHFYGRLNLEGELNYVSMKKGRLEFVDSEYDMKGYDRTEDNEVLSKSKGEYNRDLLNFFFNQEGNKVCLLDEPLDGLDPNSQDEYSKRIIEQGKKENTQIFVVSHDRLFNKQVVDEGWYHLDFYKK